MRCTCPKCSANIEIDLTSVPWTGTTARCTECQAKFLLRKESFAGKACWKAEETSCVNCGNHLDYSIVCPSCSTLYPDYFVHHPSRWMQSDTDWRDFFEFSFDFRKPATGYFPTSRTTTIAPTRAATFSRATATKVAVALAILVILVAGYSTYHIIKKRQQYSNDFFVALYGIKTGSTMCLEAGSRISTSWKNNLDNGRNDKPSLSVDEQMKLQKIKTRVDSFLQRLDKPPSKFALSREKLLKLNDTYTKLHTAILSSDASYPRFTASMNRLEQDLTQAATEFKSTLPVSLAEDFNTAKAKHKGLRDL